MRGRFSLLFAPNVKSIFLQLWLFDAKNLTETWPNGAGGALSGSTGHTQASPQLLLDMATRGEILPGQDTKKAGIQRCQPCTCNVRLRREALSQFV
jgi:hypothetical protein